MTIAKGAEVSLRTVWNGLRRARDFLDFSDPKSVKTLMQGVTGRACIHPRKIQRGDILYCLDCEWSNDPDDRRLWWEKRAPFLEATEIAKEVQKTGPRKFVPKLKKPKG